MQVKGVFYNKPVVTDNLELYVDAANINSFDPDDITYNGAAVNAQTAYTTAGTNSFVVPVGVTSISAVAVGAGGGGNYTMFDQYPGAGGGGGGLAYGTFTVTPGETLTIVVGAAGAAGVFGSRAGGAGGNSQVKRGSTVLLQGGGGGGTTDFSPYDPSDGGSGGTSTGTERDGGGSGGDGGSPFGYSNGQQSGGGGGAGGYSGDGGDGGSYGSGVYQSTAGSGGGGGGGGSDTNGAGNNGGGVGILGEGSSGAAGSQNSGGGAGSGGSGFTYGGGGGGGKGSSSGLSWNPQNGNIGSVGAVRLVYQPPTIGNRIYPDGSGTLSNIADATYSGPTSTWKDLTSSGHTITLNFSDFSSDNAGSVMFDGTDDYGTFNPGSDIAFGTGQFAIELWANFVGEGHFYFIDTRNSSQTSNRWALLMTDSEKLEWYTGSTSYFFNDGSMPTWSTGNNGWNHIVFSREGTGSNQFKAYINGEYKSAATDTTDYTNSSTEASIGRRYSGVEFLDGKISVLKIYKGKALSAAEVLQNYNALKKRYF